MSLDSIAYCCPESFVESFSSSHVLPRWTWTAMEKYVPRAPRVSRADRATVEVSDRTMQRADRATLVVSNRTMQDDSR